MSDAVRKELERHERKIQKLLKEAILQALDDGEGSVLDYEYLSATCAKISVNKNTIQVTIEGSDTIEHTLDFSVVVSPTH